MDYAFAVSEKNAVYTEGSFRDYPSRRSGEHHVVSMITSGSFAVHVPRREACCDQER